MITLVVASANRPLLDQAQAGLTGEQGIKLVGEARDGKEVALLVTRRRPTLLLLDLALPPAGGHLVLAPIRTGSPKTRVLAIDARLDEGRMLRVAKAGAHGYMLREAIPAYLPKALRVMAAGEVWLGRKLMAKVVEELQRLLRLQARARGDGRIASRP